MLCRLLLALALGCAALAQPTARLTRPEMERYLLTARIVQMRTLSEGVTGSRRATLSDGVLTHDAHIQTIDVYRPNFTTPSGTEINFSDTYKDNIAAYLLDEMLGLGMVPVSVERKVARTGAAVTWWIDDVLMTETQRCRKKIRPPDLESWNQQLYCLRVFDQLIYNTDRNRGNVVISKDWKVWLIDHTRAFRNYEALMNPKDVVKCDRHLLEAMRKLDYERLQEKLGRYLSPMQLHGLLARRDRIVEIIEKEIATKGEQAVLYDSVGGRSIADSHDAGPGILGRLQASQGIAGAAVLVRADVDPPYRNPLLTTRRMEILVERL
jgi:hypothetical protein